MSLIRAWGTGWLPDVFPTSMTRTDAGQPVDDGARGEPVDDDDVGGREQLVAARRQQAVRAGTATDEGDPAVLSVRLVLSVLPVGPGAAQVEGAGDERPLDPVADRHGQTGVAGGIRRHGDPAVRRADVRARGDAGGGA